MRTAYLVLAGITLTLVVAQFLTAGLYIFNATDSIDSHGAIAGALHLPPLLMIVAAAVGKLGRAPILLSVALLLLVSVQTGLPSAEEDAPAVAGLHPLVALVIFVVAHAALQRGRAPQAA